jgi:lipoprotein NlpI
MQARRVSTGLLLLIWLTGTNWRACDAQDRRREVIAAADTALREKKHDEAIRLASESISISPDQPGGYVIRARAYSAAGKSAEAIADLDRLIGMSPKSFSLFEARGTEKFKQQRFKEAIADFDEEIKLEPAREPWHWKRGLAYYYAGEYAKGRDQFQRYHDREDSDVENAVWRVMCMARIKEVGLKKAQEEVLVVRQDRRVPMMEVYALFAGKAKPDEVLKAIEQGEPNERERNGRTFYGHLYLGLFADMTGEPKRAIEHLKTAVEHPIDHFMWDIAKLHLARLTTKKNDETRKVNDQ